MTSASNAWSFGVTCWEILGLCRHRPFNLLSDEEVVQNAERVCYNDALQVIGLGSETVGKHFDFSQDSVAPGIILPICKMSQLSCIKPVQCMRQGWYRHEC